MNILKEQYNKLNNSTKKYYIQQIQNATEILYNKHVNEYNKHVTKARYNKNQHKLVIINMFQQFLTINIQQKYATINM